MTVSSLESCSQKDACPALNSGFKELISDGSFDNQDMLTAIELYEKENCAGDSSISLTCEEMLELLQERVEEIRVGGSISWEVDCEELRKPIANADPAIIKFFFENSGSMDGYVRGLTDFEDAIYGLLVDLDYHYDTLDLCYINKDIITEVPKEVESFISALEPDQIKKGDYKNSNLNRIFSLLLNDLGENQTTILVSDCIYSITGTQTQEKLNFEKNLTKKAFLDKLKQTDIACAVIRLDSKFNGNYWDMRGESHHKVWLSDVTRPYYMWVFGKPASVERFEEKFEFDQLKGYKNMYFLDWHQEPMRVNFSFLPNTERVGRFRADRNQTHNGQIKGIVEAESSDRGEMDGVMQFAIAFDFTELKVAEAHLLSSGSYELPEEFELVKVIPFEKDKVAPADWPKTKDAGYTHTLVVRTSVHPSLLPLFELRMKRSIPDWVVESTILNDLEMDEHIEKQDKTFGFSYIIDGITDAYKTAYPENEYIFKISATIKAD